MSKRKIESEEVRGPMVRAAEPLLPTTTLSLKLTSEHILCVGSVWALVCRPWTTPARGNCETEGHVPLAEFTTSRPDLFLVSIATGEWFPLTCSCQPIVNRLRAPDVKLATFDASGTRLALIMNCSRTVVIDTHASTGCRVVGEHGTAHQMHATSFFLIYDTVKGLLCETATAETEFTETTARLQPALIVLNETYAVCFVTGNDNKSFLVRIAFNRVEAHGIPTRQDFRNDDWQFVYEQSIVDVALCGPDLWVLTHTALFTTSLNDFDPHPRLVILPPLTDRFRLLQYNDAGKEWTKGYGRFLATMPALHNCLNNPDNIPSYTASNSDVELASPRNDWLITVDCFTGDEAHRRAILNILYQYDCVRRPTLDGGLRANILKTELTDETIAEMFDAMNISVFVPWRQVIASERVIGVVTIHGLLVLDLNAEVPRWQMAREPDPPVTTLAQSEVIEATEPRYINPKSAVFFRGSCIFMGEPLPGKPYAPLRVFQIGSVSPVTIWEGVRIKDIGNGRVANSQRYFFVGNDRLIVTDLVKRVWTITFDGCADMDIGRTVLAGFSEHSTSNPSSSDATTSLANPSTRSGTGGARSGTD